MCGIFGIIHKDKRKIDDIKYRSCLDILNHRGPDQKGTYSSDYIFFAHNRLSIFDLSTKGGQPFHYLHYTLIFNGAIYNFKELRSTLIGQGYQFLTETDTEVIAAAYDQHGADCFELFNGQWSIAIWDNRSHTLICSRDRYGIKPFYYYEDDKDFIFSSEIKAIRHALHILKKPVEINHSKVNRFLAFGMHDYDEGCFYNHIYQLKAGSLLSWVKGMNTSHSKKYYDMSTIVEQNMDTSEAISQFRALLESSIGLRTLGDRDIGLSVSGGLDSSAIACFSKSLSNSDMITSAYSVVYPEEKWNEMHYLESLHHKLPRSHQKISPDLEQLNLRMDQVLYHQDEPFDGYAVIAQYCLYDLAQKDQIGVMLEGQGADEILAGYEKFYLAQLLKKYKRNPFQLLKGLKDLSNRFPQFRLGSRFLQYVNKRNNKYPDWLIKSEEDPYSITLEEKNLSDISKNLISGLGLPSLLRYTDRNAMAHGIETRLPFLDHRLVAFCLSLPDELKVNKMKSKYILREAMKEYLPEEIYHRKDKLGFATPHQRWLEEKKEYFISEINKNGTFIENYIDLKNTPLNGQTLWRVYITNRWLSLQ